MGIGGLRLDDEEYFAFKDRQVPAEPARNPSLLLIVAALVVVGALAWILLGLHTDRCGAHERAVIENPNSEGSYISVCDR